MPVQLVIEDGAPDWWESPDIWVVPGTDPDGAPGTPVVGRPAYLWARVHNTGDADATQVPVKFWVANPSLQIRRSTADHIGTAYADVAAGASQDVLCLVPWPVTLVNGGHECVVVEAASAADPLSPTPADPDLLDAPTYRQIAQRNLSVALASGTRRSEVAITVSAGARADRSVVVQASEVERALSRELLTSLGVRAKRVAPPGRVTVGLSAQSVCGAQHVEPRTTLELDVPRGSSAAAYLSVAAREPLTPDEYAVIRVVERDRNRVVGGLSVVVTAADVDRDDVR